jgi:hypothetical protein
LGSLIRWTWFANYTVPKSFMIILEHKTILDIHHIACRLCFGQSVTRSKSFDWQNTQEKDPSVITAHESTTRLTLALWIFKFRRISSNYLAFFVQKTLEHKIIMCNLPPCRRSIKRVRSCNWLTETQSTSNVMYVKYFFMFQNDHKRLGHSVICSIDYWLLYVNRKLKWYEVSESELGLRY